MGALLRFEDILNLCRRKAAPARGIERTREAANHAIEKTTSLDLQSQMFTTCAQPHPGDRLDRIGVVLLTVAGTVSGEIMCAG